MKIVQEIEILEDSITWTVPSGPSRPGSFMISTISSMMLFSPGNDLMMLYHIMYLFHRGTLAIFGFLNSVIIDDIENRSNLLLLVQPVPQSLPLDEQ